MSHCWILRLPCRCVLAVVLAENRTLNQVVDFLFGDVPLEPGMAMELVTREEFDRDISPTFGKHTCGGAP